MYVAGVIPGAGRASKGRREDVQNVSLAMDLSAHVRGVTFFGENGVIFFGENRHPQKHLDSYLYRASWTWLLYRGTSSGKGGTPCCVVHSIYGCIAVRVSAGGKYDPRADSRARSTAGRMVA
jgi:hypothetical protein